MSLTQYERHVEADTSLHVRDIAPAFFEEWARVVQQRATQMWVAPMSGHSIHHLRALSEGVQSGPMCPRCFVYFMEQQRIRNGGIFGAMILFHERSLPLTRLLRCTNVDHLSETHPMTEEELQGLEYYELRAAGLWSSLDTSAGVDWLDCRHEFTLYKDRALKDIPLPYDGHSAADQVFFDDAYDRLVEHRPKPIAPEALASLSVGNLLCITDSMQPQVNSMTMEAIRVLLDWHAELCPAWVPGQPIYSEVFKEQVGAILALHSLDLDKPVLASLVCYARKIIEDRRGRLRCADMLAGDLEGAGEDEDSEDSEDYHPMEDESDASEDSEDSEEWSDWLSWTDASGCREEKWVAVDCWPETLGAHETPRTAAARRIQRQWESSWYNPIHSLCRKKLIRDFEELMHLSVPSST